ncbi:HAD-IIA family hydrolase [Actinomyces vulturis]|uniref:HAD-IIA family hydrolase n=1 Tax=Actinomyces vulturis TaxID=1857645 RepID=UPI000835F240|nr:HAD hydrolase-like protein [Actinomyces vulturis]
MNATLLPCDQPLMSAFDTALLDLDGVCFAGTDPIDYASQSVRAAREVGMRTMFVTNNASRPPQLVADKLTGLDIPTDPTQIFTAAMDGAAVVAQMLPSGSAVLPVGGQGVMEALADEGMRIVTSADDHPAAVLQGYDASVDWAMMSEGAYAINNGAIHVATNMDATLPTERGFALGNGSLVTAISHATRVEPIAAGKPLPGIYQRALARCHGENPVAIGDRLNTDHAGARDSSIASLHVLTGVNDARDVITAPAQWRPTFVHTDLRGLTEPHPEVDVTVNAEGDVVASVAPIGEYPAAQASVHEGELTVDGIGSLSHPRELSLNEYRAAIAAAWAWADIHGPLADDVVAHVSVKA